MEFRPHVMTWTPRAESTFEPGTNFEIPGIPLAPKAVECRFHLGGIKEFRNEDNVATLQKGSIRMDAYSELPGVGEPVKIYEVSLLLTGGSVVTVTGDIVNIIGTVHFEGRIMDVYRGQLTYRADV